MEIISEREVPIRIESDIVLVRQTCRLLAKDAGMNLVEQTKLVTAASELARNAFVHGKGGRCRIDLVREGSRTGIRLTFVDQGPGIADIEQALTDGFSTGRGLGMGLGGAKRLVNEFEINSRPGEGTTVVATRWK